MTLELHLQQSFDFQSYLAHLTGEQWDIEELDGGNTNYTVRATRRNLVNGYQERGDGTNLLCHRSIVLKQAPPYMAKCQNMLFSQYRQTIEARALNLLSSSPTASEYGLRPVLEANPGIRVPQVLYHDGGADVLIQSDLGTSPLLDGFLGCARTTGEGASRAGRCLGRFLVELHHAFDGTRACEDGNRSGSGGDGALSGAFWNGDAEKVMEGVIGNATGFMADAGVRDWEVLGRRALEHWRGRRKTAFGQGDVWFGTVIVDVREGEGDEAEGGPGIGIGICDWEFAGPNHPAGDIAQLGSYLHLSSLSPMTTACSLARLEAFSNALYGSYFSAHDLRADDREEFQRSLLIFHAWELINAAGWRHYLWCRCEGEGVKCEHITRMVREGAQLLRAAGDEGEKVEWESLKGVEWCRLLRIM